MGGVIPPGGEAEEVSFVRSLITVDETTCLKFADFKST